MNPYVRRQSLVQPSPDQQIYDMSDYQSYPFHSNPYASQDSFFGSTAPDYSFGQMDGRASLPAQRNFYYENGYYPMQPYYRAVRSAQGSPMDMRYPQPRDSGYPDFSAYSYSPLQVPDIPVTRAPLSMPQYHAYPDYSAGEAFAYTPGDDVHRDAPMEISNFYSSQPAEKPAALEEPSKNEIPSILNLMNGLEKRVVVMIRNIPNRFREEDLKVILDMSSKDLYKVIHLPYDTHTKKNLGYAFIRFFTPKALSNTMIARHGKTWPFSNSKKKCMFYFAQFQNKYEEEAYLHNRGIQKGSPLDE